MSNIYIHSKYNPQKEAQKFVDSIGSNPRMIVITEPGDSFLVEPLRKKFPSAKLIAIRYTNDEFLDSDSLWDRVWRPTTGDLVFFLLNTIPDENLYSTKFIPWKPADNIWPDQANTIWHNIQNGIKTIQSLIYTRTKFGRRWFLNIIHNIINATNICTIDFNSKDFLLTASGPSLEQTLKHNNSNIPILSVSSAMYTLSYYNIKPDLCISTDGGFYAKKYFNNIINNIPVLFPLEAAIPYNTLQNNPIVFLNYKSNIENILLNSLGIPSILAKRNGTVTGTAVELLIENNIKNIFISGLDLCTSKSFAHARPHDSVNYIYNNSDRFNTTLTGLSVSNLDSRSLETYAGWFLNLSAEKSKHLIRIGSSGIKLNNIKNITYQSFQNKKIISNKKIIVEPANISMHNKKNILKDFLSEAKKNIYSKKLPDILESTSLEREIVEFLAYPELLTYFKNENHTDIILTIQKRIENEFDKIDGVIS